MKELDLQKLTFFTEGNTFTGEYTNENGTITRYLVKPDRENDALLAYAWHKDVCYEAAEIDAEQTFALSDEGLEKIQTWLKEQVSI